MSFIFKINSRKEFLFFLELIEMTPGINTCLEKRHYSKGLYCIVKEDASVSFLKTTDMKIPFAPAPKKESTISSIDDYKQNLLKMDNDE